MIIEIRGVGFINKGAELMLHAIMQQFNSKYENITYVMKASRKTSTFSKRAEYGIFQKLSIKKFGIEFGGFISKAKRQMYGIILDREVDLVLDASGFAHGDQWGVENTKKLAKLTKIWKKNGTKIVLLPQAFGPFSNEKTKKYMNEIAKNSNLIFTRENQSHSYLLSILKNHDNIYKMPDFTNLVHADNPENFNSVENNVCIVPNYKMLTKTTKTSSYIPFLIKCIVYLRKKGKKPFILVHEGQKDMNIALEISDNVGGINIIEEADALKVKGIIGKSDAVIGSRFHSLVSALSQSIPTLGTSWSHKYKMLFEDYSYVVGLIDIDSNSETIYKKIDMIIDKDSRCEIKDNLSVESSKLKKMSIEMWSKVFKIL